MKGSEIREKARQELKDFIVFEGIYFYNLTHKQSPNWENGEDWTINLVDILGEGEELRVTLSVWDDGETTHDEVNPINSIHISLDENLFFLDNDKEEHHFGELKIDELADIANILEEAVMKIVHKEK